MKMPNGDVQNERHEPLVSIKVGRRLRPVTSRFILAVFGIIGGIWTAGTCLSPLWVRPWARPADIAAVRAEISAATAASEAATATVQIEHAETRDSVAALSRRMETSNYVLCVFLRRAQPDLLSKDCVQTITNEQRRQ